MRIGIRIIKKGKTIKRETKDKIKDKIWKKIDLFFENEKQFRKIEKTPKIRTRKEQISKRSS